MNFEAIKDLMFRIADDELVIGHRNSEWTGLGPILEEDIAFSSMAQDEVGHAQAFYIIMHEWMQEAHPDQLAFNRSPEAFRSCQFVEQPIQDYAFSLIRHFLYDTAEYIRLQDLARSSFPPLSELAQKLLREEKYHLLHAQTWIKQLGSATKESNERLQKALDKAFPMAFSLFEPTGYTEELAASNVQSTETELEARWLEEIIKLIDSSGLKLPEVKDKTVFYGGRKGLHSDYLLPLLNEMTEVFSIDPTASW